MVTFLIGLFVVNTALLLAGWLFEYAWYRGLWRPFNHPPDSIGEWLGKQVNRDAPFELLCALIGPVKLLDSLSKCLHSAFSNPTRKDLDDTAAVLVMR